MTKAKNIDYKNGMRFSCGPPMRAGSYEKWNWCKVCTRIWDKDHKRCGTCNQAIRQSRRAKRMELPNWLKQ